jgi:hypothetical protein
VLALLAASGCRALEGGSTPAVPYTILDGQTSILVDGQYDTVAEVMAAGGMTLGEADSVSPALGAPAHPATPIAIDRAAEVTVLTLDSAQTYRTQQTTLAGFLREIGLSLPPGARLLADGQTRQPRRKPSPCRNIWPSIPTKRSSSRRGQPPRPAHHGPDRRRGAG